MKKMKRSGTAAPAELIYGINPVLEAFMSGRNINMIYISARRHEKVAYIMGEAEKRGVSVKVFDGDYFDNNFPKGHQGVAARMHKKDTMSLDELIMLPDKKHETPLFIIVDCLEDPRNFGAIIRSADASGVHGIVIQTHRSVGLGPEVSKTSAGAVEHVPVSVIPNIKYAISRMKEAGITVIGAETGASAVIWDVDLTVPLAVVIGSEGKGIRRTVKDACDIMVSLPMKGVISSLNVSVAAGVFFFEIMRQRTVKLKK